MTTDDPDYVARMLHHALYGSLERRICSAEAPMPKADKDRYRWGHPDAVEIGTMLNLVVCHCPHCGLNFTSFPRPQ